MVKIGIPRGLLYYKYYPMWKTFFQHLGAETVLSPPTTKGVLSAGASRVVAETCLPVKAFMGHAISLADKCDYLFVPAIRSMKRKIHNCSKFLGLPDMTKAVVPESPPILDTEIDLDKGMRELYLSIYALGRRFTWNPLKVNEAAHAAWQAYVTYQSLMHRQGHTSPQAMEQMFPEREKGETTPTTEDSPITLAIIGHPYILYDEYINYRLLSRLKALGVRLVTPEIVEEEKLDAALVKLMEKPYWTFEDEVVGAGGYYLESQVDGVIAIVAFGCGPDSVMIALVQRYAKRLKRPFMNLTLDEHTSETGLLTRLEAFVDMMYRRKREEK